MPDSALTLYTLLVPVVAVSYRQIDRQRNKTNENCKVSQNKSKQVSVAIYQLDQGL